MYLAIILAALPSYSAKLVYSGRRYNWDIGAVVYDVIMFPFQILVFTGIILLSLIAALGGIFQGANPRSTFINQVRQLTHSDRVILPTTPE